MKSKHQKRIRWLSAMLALTASLSMTAGLTGCVGTEPPLSVDITPQVQDELGVPVDSAFLLTASAAVQQEELSSLLLVEPAADLSLSGDGKEWTLTPTEPLLENTVYTFSLRDSLGQPSPAFAFQTKGDLAVSSCYPSDGSSYVDLNTGVEITLNAPGADLKESFSIEPNVEGTLSSNGYITTFIPSKPLNADSRYRVTIKAGVSAANGMTLQEDYSFQFETSPSEDSDKWSYNDLHLNGKFAETFLPGDLLTVECRGGREELDGVKFQVEIGRFAGLEDYAKIIREKDRFERAYTGKKVEYRADPSKLTQVASLETELFLKDASYDEGLRYIMLPELEPGWYLVTASGTSNSGRPQFVQKLIQICSQSVYVQSSNGETLVWLNDPNTGNPQSQASLSFEDSVTGEKTEGKTGEDGTAVLSTGDSAEAYLTIQGDGGAVYFEPVSLSGKVHKPLNQSYYTALYTDREIYQPDDTIQFWGVVSPRQTSVSLPEEVTVSLGASWPFSPIYQQTVPVGKDGTFKGSMKITGLKKDYYSFQVSDGKRYLKGQDLYTDEPGVYTSKGFSIEEYTKPPFVITSEPEKAWYYANEPFQVSIRANYFDGTPVSGGRLNLSSAAIQETRDQAVDLALNEKGEGQFTGTYSRWVYQDDEVPTWTPDSIWYYLNSRDSEDVYINYNGVIPVLPSKIACKTEATVPSELTVYLSQIDTEKLEKWYQNNQWGPDYDEVAGAPVDLPVTVIVHKWENIKIPNGSYYDPISKKTVPKYTYDRKEIIADTIQTQTVNGKAVLTDLPYKIDETGEYWFEIRFDGQVQGEVCEYQYFYQRYESSRLTVYTFLEKEDPFEALTYRVGESIPLALYANREKIDNKGRVLYTVMQQDILDSGIYSSNEINLPFLEEYVPNMVVNGAYFDGKHVFQMESLQASLNYDTRTLKVEVSSDQETYSPGDKASLTVKLTDSEGKPAAGTACVGVVDESIFVLAPQELNFASQISRKVFSPNVQRTVSYEEYDMAKMNPNAGGMGGGGGDGAPIREDFRDTALFKTVEIGESGARTVELTLPDNITSWRVTAAAVTADLKGGDGIGNAITTLPFSIRPVFTDTYCEGDDVSVSITPVSAGTGNAPARGDSVAYQIEILSADGKPVQSKEISGSIGAPATANFGKLPLGQYSLSVKGTCGEWADQVKQPFSVAKVGVTADRMQTCTLEEMNQIDSLRYPVSIMVFDEALAPYMKGVQALANGGDGDRTERMAAAYKAQAALNRLLPEGRFTLRKDLRLDQIQTEEGGVKFLPASEASAETTAKILLTAPDLIHSGSAVEYLKKRTGDETASPSERIFAYVGLAAAKQPVLQDCKLLLKDSSLSPAQKLYLAAGFAKAGDKKQARLTYESLSELRKEKNGLIYLDGETEEEKLENTAAALMAASLSGHSDAAGLMLWLLEQYSVPAEGRATLANLEMLSYLENFHPELKKPARFSYTQNGQKQTEEVGATGVSCISLNAEDFAASKFRAESGKLSALVRYTGYAADTAQPSGSQGFQITKTIEPVTGDGFALHGMVKVSLEISFGEDAPAGCYEISDVIPSGLRFINNQNYRLYDQSESITCISRNEGQQVKGYLYYNPKSETGDGGGIEPRAAYEEAAVDTENPSEEMEIAGEIPEEDSVPKNYTFVYYANSSLPGEFVSQSAYLSIPEKGISVASNQGTILIPENK